MQSQIKQIFSTGIFFAVLAAPLYFYAGEPAGMMENLDIIKTTFSVKYAPAEWKKSFTGWDLDDQIAIAKGRVDALFDLDLKGYHRILNQLFCSAKDYHVSIHFYSSELAYLPFRVKGSQGRYFVVWVDRTYFQGQSAPIRVGDELISFGGKAAHEAVMEIKSQDFGNPDSLTDQALAEAALTLRLGSIGQSVPSGKVRITIQRAGEGRRDIELDWFYVPEEFKSPSIKPHCKGFSERGVEGPLGEHPCLHKKMEVPFSSALKKAVKQLKLKLSREKLLPVGQEESGEEDGLDYLGAKKSFVPELGKIFWRAPSSKLFHAYLYELPGAKGKIGYIRIPNYQAWSSLSAYEFGKIIGMFEKSSDALVIDQVDNSGGDFFYLCAIASMLSDYPLQIPTQQLAITQEDVAFALQFGGLLGNIRSDAEAKEFMGPSISGYKVDFELAKGFNHYLQGIIQEWNSGRSLTGPCHVFGIEKIKPHPTTRYTKPILLLVNSLSFSAADYLPAILQDNCRATIFGTPTAGAGGFVEALSFPNVMGIEFFTYTASFAERPNRRPIENLGVVPDIFYEPTPEDLQYGFPGYASAVNKAVLELLHLHEF